MLTRYLRVFLCCAMVATAISAIGAGAAQAATGPEWIVAGGGGLSGESVVTGKVIGSNATLSVAAGLLTIECSAGSSEAAIKGGNPGTDTGKIKFTGCKIPGTTCEAGAGGVIETNEFASELVFPKGTKGSALDAFYPKTGSVFATFGFSTSTACPTIIRGKTIKVEATGTEAPETIGPVTKGQKCGVLTQVGKDTALTFELGKRAELAKLGALNAPTTAITEANLSDANGEKAITCGLEVPGIGVATFSALFTQLLLSNGEFGWK